MNIEGVDGFFELLNLAIKKNGVKTIFRRKDRIIHSKNFVCKFRIALNQKWGLGGVEAPTILVLAFANGTEHYSTKWNAYEICRIDDAMIANPEFNAEEIVQRIVRALKHMNEVTKILQGGLTDTELELARLKVEK